MSRLVLSVIVLLCSIPILTSCGTGAALSQPTSTIASLPEATLDHPPTAQTRSEVNPLPSPTPVLLQIPADTPPAPTPKQVHQSQPSPTATFTPTPRPIALPSLTPLPPTLTPTPLHPLMIEAMRQETYPGSDIVIESELDPGSNYERYIASYLSEGLKINALLTVPQGQRPESGWPVIVFNHGYIPPDQYRTTERYVAYVDAFARNGYIVFRPDYRGHGDSEGEPSSSYGSPDYTVDILNGVASVKGYSEADPNRVGMWGHSMGGSITLRTMVVTGDIKAGVIWTGTSAPYSEIIERWERISADRPTPTPGPRPTRRRWAEELLEYGTTEDNPAFWASIDPISYLGDLSGPFQLHHGTADESVPVEYSENLYTRLQEAGQPSELYLYEADNHNISNHLGVAMERSVQFFNMYVSERSSHPESSR